MINFLFCTLSVTPLLAHSSKRSKHVVQYQLVNCVGGVVNDLNGIFNFAGRTAQKSVRYITSIVHLSRCLRHLQRRCNFRNLWLFPPVKLMRSILTPKTCFLCTATHITFSCSRIFLKKKKKISSPRFRQFLHSLPSRNIEHAQVPNIAGVVPDVSFQVCTSLVCCNSTFSLCVCFAS